jgi:hypothetical protein
MCACVGLPPSPPQGADATGSSGANTTVGPSTTSTSNGSTGLEGSDTTQVDDDGSSTQSVQASTSTGDTMSATSSSGSTSTDDALGSTSTDDGPGSTTGTGPTCDELYGMAPDYLLCMETDSECHFNATTDGSNCNAMCAIFMGTCIGAIDNPGGGCAGDPAAMDTCDTNRFNEICICSK